LRSLITGFAPRPTRLDFGEIPTGASEIAQDTSSIPLKEAVTSSTSATPTRQSKGPAPPVPTHAGFHYRNDQVIYACYLATESVIMLNKYLL
jgi:hypothetical protein